MSADLQRSHIVPEAFYRYDERHRMLYVRGGDQTPEIQQKGTREPLLCASCEQHFNEHFEKPMKAMWLDDPKLPQILNMPAIEVQGLNYERFKLFHLSVLWRGAVASVNRNDVDLGRHEAIIHRMLRDQNPGPSTIYPIVGVALRLPKTHEVASGVVMLPRWGRMSGQIVYRAIFGGCAWHYVISNHPVDPEIQEWALSEAGEMRLLVENFRNLQEIDYLVSNYQKNAARNGWSDPFKTRRQRKRGG